MSSKSSNSFLQRVADCIYGIVFPAGRFEGKLFRCQNYRPKSVDKWRCQAGLSWAAANKFLENPHVFDGQRIWDLIRTAVNNRADVFAPGSFYITSFGPLGKSGCNVLYDFSHAMNVSRATVETWGIAELPAHSRIIFVDDLIGTGTQSLGYIQPRLSSLLSPSHKPCLFSICGTSTGIKNV